MAYTSNSLHSLLLFAAFVGTAGCSSTATVTGKVTADGKDVTSGGIVLSPLSGDRAAAAGKPGMADIRPDGTFTMDLELAASGVNRYAVRFSPAQTVSNKSFKDGVIPYMGYNPKQTEVEIKPGPNAISIELTSKRK